MEMQKMDEFNRKAISILGMEEAPADLTAKIMAQLQGKSAKASLQYKPLISGQGWMVLLAFTAIILAIFWLLAAHGTHQQALLPSIPFDELFLRYIQPITAKLLESVSRYALFLAGGLTVTGLLLIDRLFSVRIRKLLV